VGSSSGWDPTSEVTKGQDDERNVDCGKPLLVSDGCGKKEKGWEQKDKKGRSPGGSGALCPSNRLQ